MWVQRHPKSFDYAKAKFATGADGWLVANEQVHGTTMRSVRSGARQHFWHAAGAERPLRLAGHGCVTRVIRNLPSIQDPRSGLTAWSEFRGSVSTEDVLSPSEPSSPVHPRDIAEPARSRHQLLVS